MALGIHIGGCSCACVGVSNVNTLWKIRLSDGAIIWRSNRGGGSSVSVELKNFGDLYVYEGGQAGGESGVTKWLDNGADHDRQWDSDMQTGLLSLPDNSAQFLSDFDQSTRTMPNRIAITDDGAVWMVTRLLSTSLLADEYMTRISGADGSTLRHSSIALGLGGSIYPWTIRRIYAGPAGVVPTTGPEEGRIYVVWQGMPDAFRSVEQIFVHNTLFTKFNAQTQGIVFHSHWTPIDGDYSNGFFSYEQFGFAYKQNTTTSLNGFPFSPTGNIASAPVRGNFHPANVENSANGGYGIGLGRTSGRLDLFDGLQVVRTSSPMAVVQSLTFEVDQALKPPRYPATADSSANGYIAIGGTVYCVTGSAVVWSATFSAVGEGSVQRIAVDESNGVLVVAGKTMQVDGEYHQVIALSIATGVVVWKLQLSDSALLGINDIRVQDGYVYACGDPM